MSDVIEQNQITGPRDIFQRAAAFCTPKNLERARHLALWSVANYLGYKVSPVIGADLTICAMLYGASIGLNEDKFATKAATIYIAGWGVVMGSLFQVNRNRDFRDWQASRPPIEQVLSSKSELSTLRQN